ncbi:2Fe-2S ferredoxin [Candidatus Cyrtobacter comes]|uniref:Adrenodoxin-like protein n=1 Tax=Candidatus Cyrtobacter comes TaxID=675776 RepID=A0ABU5L6B4_9RICK|nr:2Fe-2S iron-sulfur cluster-binding protein [Candidatus Cyrtobacter comes]MDZ5761668.1 2Fe-2S ferredoxin [Candidatus Cyrtobacter comes]
MVKIIFINKEGAKIEIEAQEGLSIMEVGRSLGIEGACNGSLACSTCHVIVENKSDYDKLQKATEEEEDMLDLAFGLTPLSRLSCQIIVNKDLEGMVFKFPSATRNVLIN